MVFAERAAKDIAKRQKDVSFGDISGMMHMQQYQDVNQLQEEYKRMVLEEIEKER